MTMNLPTRLCALLLAALFLPGCSMLTANGRREAAYSHYVNKQSQGRVKQRRMFHSNKPQMPVNDEPAAASEPVESVSAGTTGPEAVGENPQ
jgi:hypothetical protein